MFIQTDYEYEYDPDPCVGCGFCCFQAKCTASMRLYPNTKEICPQLIWDETEQRYFCGLAQFPGPLGDLYKEELYIGAGCCSNLNSWRKDVKNRHPKKEEKEKLKLSSEFQIFLKCLSCNCISSDLISLTISHFTSELVNQGKYSKEDAEILGNLIKYYFQGHRNSFMEEFMG